jgi:general secretion pathway protein J
MNNKKGFTLFEMMVALTIITIIATALYASLRVGMQTYKKQEECNYLHQNLRNAVFLLSRDLRCAFMSANSDIIFSGDPGKNQSLSEARISLVTCQSSVLQRAGGLSTVEYYIDNDPQTPCSGLVRVDHGFPQTEERNVCQEIAPLVEGLRLRYYNGSEWQDEWGQSDPSQLHTLPQAVEITVTVKDKESNNKGFVEAGEHIQTIASARTITVETKVPVYACQSH